MIKNLRLNLTLRLVGIQDPKASENSCHVAQTLYLHSRLVLKKDLSESNKTQLRDQELTCNPNKQLSHRSEADQVIN